MATTKLIIRWVTEPEDDEKLADELEYIVGLIRKGYSSGIENYEQGIRSWELK